MVGLSLSKDTIERIEVVFRLFIEFCRVSIGCFTTVFVSNKCPNSECNFDNSTTFEPETNFEKYAFYVNISTCILFVLLYSIEMYRENWLIERFDNDPTFPQNELLKSISVSLSNRLKVLNLTYWRITLVTSIFFVINVLISGIYIASQDMTLRTGTAFFGFTILLGQKIFYAASISFAGRSGEIAQSAYLTFPCTFNIMDPDYELKKNKIIPV